MTNQTGSEPEEAFRNRAVEDAADDDLSVEGHGFKVGRATGEPGPDDVRPRATEDDLDVEGHRIRP